MKSPESPSAFGYRMGWLRASLGQKGFGHSLEIPCAIVAFCKVCIPTTTSGVLVKLSPLCSSTNQSKGKNASIDAMVTNVSYRKTTKRSGEVINARPRFPKSMGADVCKTSTDLQEVNIEIMLPKTCSSSFFAAVATRDEVEEFVESPFLRRGSRQLIATLNQR